MLFCPSAAHWHFRHASMPHLCTTPSPTRPLPSCRVFLYVPALVLVVVLVVVVLVVVVLVVVLVAVLVGVVFLVVVLHTDTRSVSSPFLSPSGFHHNTTFCLK